MFSKTIFRLFDSAPDSVLSPNDQTISALALSDEVSVGVSSKRKIPDEK